ncbi:hypothetical protein [Mycobacterium sp. C31M]
MDFQPMIPDVRTMWMVVATTAVLFGTQRVLPYVLSEAVARSSVRCWSTSAMPTPRWSPTGHGSPSPVPNSTTLVRCSPRRSAWVWRGRVQEDLAATIRRADMAMYRAKYDGRDSVVRAEPER